MKTQEGVVAIRARRGVQGLGQFHLRSNALIDLTPNVPCGPLLSEGFSGTGLGPRFLKRSYGSRARLLKHGGYYHIN